jgi:hypothetical protein
MSTSTVQRIARDVKTYLIVQLCLYTSIAARGFCFLNYRILTLCNCSTGRQRRGGVWL